MFSLEKNAKKTAEVNLRDSIFRFGILEILHIHHMSIFKK